LKGGLCEYLVVREFVVEVVVLVVGVGDVVGCFVFGVFVCFFDYEC